MKRFVIIMLKIGIFLLILSLWGFYSAIRPFKIISTVTPADYKIAYENISFKTQDNVLIRGWFIPNQNPHAKTLILLHGYPADKGDILAATIYLHENYHLLYFDFRYLGASAGTYSTIGKNEILDLQAAIAFLNQRNINTVGVWGFSMGGAVALMAAPITPAIKAIVAEASFARLDWMGLVYYRIPLLNYVLTELTRYWGLLFLHYDMRSVAPVRAVKDLTIPILLIHSKHDTLIPFDHALTLQEALKNNPKVETLFIENAAHGEHLVIVDKTILQFFNKNLN